MSVRKRVYRNHFPFFLYNGLLLLLFFGFDNKYIQKGTYDKCMFFFFLHNYTINCELKVLMID